MSSEFPKEPQINETKEYESYSTEFDYFIIFFENFSELVSYNGRIISFITSKNIVEFDTSLIDNSVQTLKSIKHCCSIGAFADANTLIRKLRDDLLLYIYILAVINNRKPFIEDDLKKVDFTDAEKFASSFLNLKYNDTLTMDEQAVNAWLNNVVDELPYNVRKKLSFENYMKFLRQNEHINKILTDYKLQDYWEKLRNNLNNYVHNNGLKFTSQNFVRSNNKNLEIHFKNISFRTSYISSFFLSTLLMVESSLICSTDFIDYMDCNIDPPEGCQYFIAPFVQDFIDSKVALLHPELKQFLKDHNVHSMKID